MIRVKKFFSKGFLSLLTLVALIFANSACHGRLYEEELPKTLVK